VAVHVRHLQLVLEVRDRAQAAQDDSGVLALAVVDEEPVEGVDLHAAGVFAHLFDRLADHLDALVDREERVLARVVQHRDDDLLERDEAAPEDRGVAVRDGVEGAGVDGDAHRDLRGKRSVERGSGAQASGAAEGNVVANTTTVSPYS